MTGYGGHESYCLRVLEELGQNPAVSFMEDGVVHAITKALEDIGYEAIDNLPLSLVPRLLDGPP